MAKLCPRGKAAAKRKFKVYPSAYANMYASAVCSGKVTPGGKKKRKKAMGGGSMRTELRGGGLARRKRMSCAQLLFRRWFKKMGIREMGRHWSSEKERKVSTVREIEGEQKKVSKMRPTCKSHTDDKRAKGECCQTKKTSGQ